MRGLRVAAVVVLGVVPLVATSCGGGKAAAPSKNTPPGSGVTTTTSRPTATSTSSSPATKALTVSVVASPNPVSSGVPVTFTVAIRGPGVLSGEDVHFGDGGTTGANAGMISCGQTSRADLTHAWTHSYAAHGTYEFREEANALGPPPGCHPEEAAATVTVIVSSPLQTATLNGAFLSPTKNIACNIEPAAPVPVRCATFSPPQLVRMDPGGSITTCSGSQCDLGNPASGAPVLSYGIATGSGPYQCVSAVTGMTCTVTGGKGFTISRIGIQPVGQ